MSYNDPTYGNGVSIEAVQAPYDGLDIEVENFDPANLILNGNFVTPTPYSVQQSDGVYGFFALDLSENAYLIPATITVAAVPEPSSWTMMVGALGLCGGIIRRSRRRDRRGVSGLTGA